MTAFATRPSSGPPLRGPHGSQCSAGCDQNGRWAGAGNHGSRLPATTFPEQKDTLILKHCSADCEKTVFPLSRCLQCLPGLVVSLLLGSRAPVAHQVQVTFNPIATFPPSTLLPPDPNSWYLRPFRGETFQTDLCRLPVPWAPDHKLHLFSDSTAAVTKGIKTC